MSSRRGLCFKLFSFLFIPVLFAINSSTAFAYTEIEQKAYGFGVYNCYNNVKDNKGNFVVRDPIESSAVRNYTSIISTNGNKIPALLVERKKQLNVKVPCYKLIGEDDGGGGFNGLLFAKGMARERTTAKEQASLLTTLGFLPSQGADGGCFTIKYTSEAWVEDYDQGKAVPVKTTDYRTLQLCGPNSGLNKDNLIDNGDNYYTGPMVIERQKDSVFARVSLGPETAAREVKLADVNSIEELRNKVRTGFMNAFNDVAAKANRYASSVDEAPCNVSAMGSEELTLNCYGDTVTFNVNSGMEIEQYEGGEYSFQKAREKQSFVAIQNLLDTDKIKKLDDFKFTDNQKWTLYTSILKDFYGAKTFCPSDSEADRQSAASFEAQGYKATEVYFKTTNTTSQCYVIPTDKENANKTVNGLNSDKSSKYYYMYDGTQKTFQDLVAESDVSQLSGFDPDELDELIIDPAYKGMDTDDPCWNSGIDSMAWVLCPAEKNLQYFASGIGGFIDEQLATKSTLYETGGSANIAWGYVRTIANALMIILLIFVIFSQLTGFGIDNYGIKKILPKLILMAILINLSFLICQLVIDFSNIIGYGIQQLFYGVGNEIIGSTRSAQAAMSNFIGLLVPAIYALAGGGSVAIGLVSAGSGGGVMGVLLVILMLLSILAAVLMFFVSIGARTVIIIMCAVLSPLAFACYILPNTKSIYKKWFDAFKTALVIYPICGLLIGISYVIKAIAVTQNDLSLAFAVIAGIAPYLPFFMIPSMIRGTLGALGSIGAALSAAGNSFRGTVGRGTDAASGAIKNSNAYKSGVEAARRRSTMRQAGLDKNGNERKMTRFGRFIRGGDSGIAAARAQYLKDKNAESREAGLMGDGFAAAVTNQQKAAEADAVKDYMTLINDQTRNGEDDVAFSKMVEKYRNEGNKQGLIAAARIAGRRKDTAASFMKSFESDYSSYDSSMAASIAKEITTGENSGNFMSSSPLGFGWASAVNKGQGSTSSYGDWLRQKNNNGVSNAQQTLDNLVTDSKGLSSMKAGNLRELNGLMNEEGVLDNSMKSRIRSMASEVIENRDKIPMDWSKAADLAVLSGSYDYSIVDGKGSFAPKNTSNGTAQEGEIVKVDQITSSGILLNPSGDTVRQLKQNADKNMPNGGRIK